MFYVKFYGVLKPDSIRNLLNEMKRALNKLKIFNYQLLMQYI